MTGLPEPAELAWLVGPTRARLGLDRSVVGQYFTWLGHALSGDLGTSFYSDQSVVAVLRERIPATTQLAVTGMALTLLIAIPAFASARPLVAPWRPAE